MIWLVVMAVAFAGCAQSGDDDAADSGDRTVVITMRDIEFEPDEISVRRGEEITLRFINRGAMAHDAFIGDEDAQEEHEKEARMADDEGHAGGHAADEENAIILEPGDRGDITYRFTERGETLIGCHEPGHYDDGMIVKVTVR